MPNGAWFLTLLVVVLIVGAIIYVLDRLPIDATFKMIAKVVAIVGFVIWLLLEVRRFIA
jgi:hypothetical protein